MAFIRFQNFSQQQNNSNDFKFSFISNDTLRLERRVKYRQSSQNRPINQRTRNVSYTKERSQGYVLTRDVNIFYQMSHIKLVRRIFKEKIKKLRNFCFSVLVEARLVGNREQPTRIDEELIADTRMIHIVYCTGKYHRKSLKISKDVLQNNYINKNN